MITTHDDTSTIVPFGKYKGRPIEAMMADRDYCSWAMAQSGLRARFSSVFAIIVNGGTAPDAPTPEHNRLQLLFRNPDMRLAAYRSIVGEEAINREAGDHLSRDNSILAAGDGAALAVIDEGIAKGTLRPKHKFERSGFTRDEWERKWRLPGKLAYVPFHFDREAFGLPPWTPEETAEPMASLEKAIEAVKELAKAAGEAAAQQRLRELLESDTRSRWADEAIRNAPVEFEVRGWDVVIGGPCGHIHIELKPMMGDDYPAVLRAMKMRYDRYGVGKMALIVDHFEAEGAALDDVKWIFKQSRIVVRTLAEIRAALVIGKAA